MNIKEKNDKYWDELWKRGVLEREYWIGDGWEKKSIHFPGEIFLEYDNLENDEDWTPDKFPLHSSIRYPSYAIYRIDGVERLVWAEHFFYAAAVDKPSKINRTVLRNAIKLHRRKEKEGYVDVHVVLCEQGGCNEDRSRIYDKYGESELGGVRSMDINETGRISMYLK